jgi:hypothetical protein
VPLINRRFSVFLVTSALNIVAMDPLLSALRIISDKWINAKITIYIVCIEYNTVQVLHLVSINKPYIRGSFKLFPESLYFG